MFTIAVTGGIASGKSLFGKMLVSLGVDVIDADEIVHGLHLPGGSGAQAVASAFGGSYLRQDGGTDRAKLAELVFGDAAARSRLDELLHPLVRNALLSWKVGSGAEPFKIAQIPLLFEKGWESDWDLTIDVESPMATRLERLRVRGLSEEQMAGRLAAQMTSAQRMAMADIVVFNNAGIEDLEQIARRLIHYLENKQA